MFLLLETSLHKQIDFRFSAVLYIFKVNNTSKNDYSLFFWITFYNWIELQLIIIELQFGWITFNRVFATFSSIHYKISLQAQEE